MTKNTVDYFEENGYVVLQNVLPKEKCDELVAHMFKLHEEGKLVQDDQCPLSDAIYGDSVFDNLLQNVAEPLGKAVGKKLLPTYSYARIYRPGDVLKKHLDRPACEISTTLTLGYDAKVNWPIHFANQDGTKETAVTMEPGEMAAYKGTEMVHWRKPFKGNWHVQVFLHFVDANGPHANQAMDGRQSLGVDKTAQTMTQAAKPPQKQQENVVNQPRTDNLSLKKNNEMLIPDPIFGGVILPSTDNTLPGYFPVNSETFPTMMFTNEECDRIIQIAKDSYSSAASVGSGKKGNVAKQIRSAEIYPIENDEENRWIFKKIASVVSVVNAVHFEYDISAIEYALQLIHYPSDADVPGHYNWHVDAGPGAVATRKISFTAQLSDPNSYTGCDLIVDDHGNKIQASRERGSFSLFPSYMPHVVTPIETGDRYALVIWIHGSRRFR
jgi:predicted 2-oxoglutarate/Fe(II)-dependent dioxygenase YbiX